MVKNKQFCPFFFPPNRLFLPIIFPHDNSDISIRVPLSEENERVYLEICVPLEFLLGESGLFALKLQKNK